MVIKDIMTRRVVTIEKGASFLRAKKMMADHRIERLPVIENSRLVGLITRKMMSDLSPLPATPLSVRQLNYLMEELRIEDIMVKEPLTITPETEIEEVFSLIKERGIEIFPVIENGKLVGIVTESDITGCMASAKKMFENDSRKKIDDTSGLRTGA